MDHLVAVLTLWLSIEFGLPAYAPPPEIEFLPEPELTRLWMEGVARRNGMDVDTIARQLGEVKIEAFYDDTHATISLAEDWSADSRRDVSTLVHELVHHLQQADGRQYRCPAAREQLAYEAQERWLALFDASLETQFHIDALTLRLHTRCMMH